MNLKDWLKFSNRYENEYDPASQTRIFIERFWQNEKSDFDSEGWRKEEWSIMSALVPTEGLEIISEDKSSFHHLEFDIGWNFEDEFNFGKISNYANKFDIYPLADSFQHPIKKELVVKLNDKFKLYHALEKRELTKYYHPVDKLLVAEAKTDFHEIYNPTPNVKIHRDYLRDFLAATNTGLFISLIAERSANTSLIEELDIPEIEDEEIDQFTWLSTIIHSSDLTRHGFNRIRSILKRNVVIQPYKEPKYERSPWYYFGEIARDDSELPKFIVDDEGTKRILPQETYLPLYLEEGIGSMGYLYFRPEVLHKYLEAQDFDVFFHMRNWGIAQMPGDIGTIDVGINTHDLVNAFAPDIAELPISEQSYWSSHSSLPSGEICEELYQTRMQSNPPDAPGICDVIRTAKSQLDNKFQVEFSRELYKEFEPDEKILKKLSVGPIRNENSEVIELSKLLYGWVIETIEIPPLRKAITSLEGNTKKEWRQIKLLETLLTSLGIEYKKARSITAPLASLYDLRIGFAHIGSVDIEECYNLMHSDSTELSARQGWDLCVDSVSESLNKIAEIIQNGTAS